jgi:hypothetical protein
MLQNGAQQSCRSPQRKLKQGIVGKTRKTQKYFLEV